MVRSTSLLHNLKSVGAMRLGTAALSFLLFWVLAQQLGSAAIGAFSLLFSVYLFTQYLPLLGLHIAVVRDASSAATDQAALLSSACAIALPMGLVFALAIGIIGKVFYPPELHAAFWLVGLAIIPTAWTDVVEASLMGRQRMDILARVNLREAMLRVIGSILVVSAGGGLSGVFAVFLLGRLYAVWAYARHSRLPTLRLAKIESARVRIYLRESPVFFAILLLSMLSSRLDMFMLSRLVPLHELGVYAVGARMYEAMLMVPSVVSTALYPALLRMREDGGEGYAELLEQSLFWALMLGLPCAIAVNVLADTLISLLFPLAFHEASAVLQWLALAALFTAIDQILACAMLASHAQRKDLGSQLFGVLVLITVLALFIHAFGIAGASAAVALAILLRVCWRLRWLAQTGALHAPWRHVLAPLAAGALSLALLHLAPATHWTLQLVATLACYLLAARLLGAINGNSMLQLKAALLLLRQGRAG